MASRLGTAAIRSSGLRNSEAFCADMMKVSQNRADLRAVLVGKRRIC